MELIASVSRSSGMEKDGDALKDYKTQEEYRAFIQDKLDSFWRMHSTISRKEKQENILILFRKLREGLVSSERKDQFAVEAYETSLFLAILFDSPRQTTTILSHLIPDLYSTISTSLRDLTTLISLVHHLAAAYPSQSTFRQHLHSLPPSLRFPDSESCAWITSLASSLRSLNYSKFEELTRPSSFSHLLIVSNELGPKTSSKTTPSESFDSVHSSANLANRALQTLVEALRTTAREKTWHIIRSAYRELACHPESGATRDWLERSLALPSIVPTGKAINLDDWLEKKCGEGQIRKKDGTTEGRWIICKVR